MCGAAALPPFPGTTAARLEREVGDLQGPCSSCSEEQGSAARGKPQNHGRVPPTLSVPPMSPLSPRAGRAAGQAQPGGGGAGVEAQGEGGGAAEGRAGGAAEAEPPGPDRRPGAPRGRAGAAGPQRVRAHPQVAMARGRGAKKPRRAGGRSTRGRGLLARRAQQEQMEKEKAEAARKAALQRAHAGDVRRQMQEWRQRRAQERAAAFEEFQRLQEEARRRSQRITELKEKKMQELRCCSLSACSLPASPHVPKSRPHFPPCPDPLSHHPAGSSPSPPDGPCSEAVVLAWHGVPEVFFPPQSRRHPREVLRPGGAQGLEPGRRSPRAGSAPRGAERGAERCPAGSGGAGVCLGRVFLQKGVCGAASSVRPSLASHVQARGWGGSNAPWLFCPLPRTEIAPHPPPHPCWGMLELERVRGGDGSVPSPWALPRGAQGGPCVPGPRHTAQPWLPVGAGPSRSPLLHPPWKWHCLTEVSPRGPVAVAFCRDKETGA